MLSHSGDACAVIQQSSRRPCNVTCADNGVLNVSAGCRGHVRCNPRCFQGAIVDVHRPIRPASTAVPSGEMSQAYIDQINVYVPKVSPQLMIDLVGSAGSIRACGDGFTMSAIVTGLERTASNYSGAAPSPPPLAPSPSIPPKLHCDSEEAKARPWRPW